MTVTLHHAEEHYTKAKRSTRRGAVHSIGWLYARVVRHEYVPHLEAALLVKSCDPDVVSVTGIHHRAPDAHRFGPFKALSYKHRANATSTFSAGHEKLLDFEKLIVVGESIVAEFGFTAHIRSRGEEARAIKKKAGFKARRWVCERTHSWFNRFRRILIRWEKKPENYLGLLHLVCAIIAFRRAGLIG